jgi:hypothetical protein
MENSSPVPYYYFAFYFDPLQPSPPAAYLSQPYPNHISNLSLERPYASNRSMKPFWLSWISGKRKRKGFQVKMNS